MRHALLALFVLVPVVGLAGWYLLKPAPDWQAQVLKRLKDPGSAQFRNVVVSDVTNWVCGEVNSKNSLGGYVGFKRFMVQSPIEMSREEWSKITNAPYRTIWKVTFEDDYGAVIGSCE